ncbi:MAG TPA: hypothetical protein VK066_18805 [Chloroflexota bacterium]|nr:hypothetical protein [Chloroflexota bacterium]
MAAELGSPPTYPVMGLLRQHGRAAALSAAGVAFALAVGGSHDRGAASILRGLAWAAVAGAAVKNLAELNQVVAETLLPQ